MGFTPANSLIEVWRLLILPEFFESLFKIYGNQFKLYIDHNFVLRKQIIVYKPFEKFLIHNNYITRLKITTRHTNGTVVVLYKIPETSLEQLFTPIPPTKAKTVRSHFNYFLITRAGQAIPLTRPWSANPATQVSVTRSRHSWLIAKRPGHHHQQQQESHYVPVPVPDRGTCPNNTTTCKTSSSYSIFTPANQQELPEFC